MFFFSHFLNFHNNELHSHDNHKGSYNFHQYIFSKSLPDKACNKMKCNNKYSLHQVNFHVLFPFHTTKCNVSDLDNQKASFLISTFLIFFKAVPYWLVNHLFV